MSERVERSTQDIRKHPHSQSTSLSPLVASGALHHCYHSIPIQTHRTHTLGQTVAICFPEGLQSISHSFLNSTTSLLPEAPRLGLGQGSSHVHWDAVLVTVFYLTILLHTQWLKMAHICYLTVSVDEGPGTAQLGPCSGLSRYQPRLVSHVKTLLGLIHFQASGGCWQALALICLSGLTVSCLADFPNIILVSPMPARRILLAKQALESCHLCSVLQVKSKSELLLTLKVTERITQRCEYHEAQIMGTTLENGNWIRSTFFFFLPSLVDCRILLPLPGTDSALTAMEVRSLNHWTVREIPGGALWQELKIFSPKVFENH